MYGFYGKTAVINLTNSTSKIITFDGNYSRNYLGGNGIASKIIYDMVPANCDPLSEDNVVVFATGPFNGTPLWGAGRGHCAAISPQTGYFGDSNFGGHFAAKLKKTGYDAVVLTGKASSPVYIKIEEQDIQIIGASELWGLPTGDTAKKIKEKEGKGFETAVIGPAGENLVPYSCIICSGTRVSAAGRCGIGAVMGSKNVKALTVNGTQKPEIADPDALKAYMKENLVTLKERAKVLTETGTPFLVNMINGKGKLCTKNNQRETWNEADKISGELIIEKYKKKNTACHGCPIACGKLVNVPRGEFADTAVKMPEYETLYSMGTMLENSDPVSIFNGNALCDEMGMDTISFGVTLSFLTECVEKGLVQQDELDLPVYFGEQKDIETYIRNTALNKGKTGQLLAMGSEKMAQEIGKDSKNFLYTVKGLEIPGHSARGLRHMGLGYATATRGGSHHDARPMYLATDPEVDPGFENQPQLVVEQQHSTAIGDALVLCRFVSERIFGTKPNETYLPVMKYITGWEMDLAELIKAGERIYNLERLINVRQGVSRDSDTLPYRVLHEAIPEGPSKGWHCSEAHLNQMLDEYYQLRGWDTKGIPTEEKKLELNIS